MTDLGKNLFLGLVERAAELKRAKADGTQRPRLTGRTIALIYEKSSTRTRRAFEVAAHDQGAHTTYLDPAGAHIGRRSPRRDTAQVLGRMFDGIEFRGFAQDTVEQLADHTGVPCSSLTALARQQLKIAHHARLRQERRAAVPGVGVGRGRVGR